MQRTSRTSRGGAKPSSGAKKPQERWCASAAKERTDVVAGWTEKAADLNEVIEEKRPGAAAPRLPVARAAIAKFKPGCRVREIFNTLKFDAAAIALR